MEIARTAQGFRGFEERFAERRRKDGTGMQVRAACGEASPGSTAPSGASMHTAGPKGSQGDMQVPDASGEPSPDRTAAQLGQAYPQYELRSGGVTVRFDNVAEEKPQIA